MFEAYRLATGTRAVLVGGAAASIHSNGMILSGDFDVVAGFDDAFHTAMRAEGFVTEDRSGHLLVGWYHPALPRFGVQLVTGPLFD